MQGAGFRHEAAALLKEIGDIFAAIGAEFMRVGDGAAGCLGAEDFTQGDDLLNVVPHVHPALAQLLVIHLGLGREAQELEQ
jgi:hypothetical protein